MNQATPPSLQDGTAPDLRARAAWVLPLLALAWVLLHAFALYLSGRLSAPGAPWWAFGGPTQSVLVDLGALVPARVALGEWQRLITHAFLHASLLHLVLNVWVGWSAGRSLERIAGPSRTWIVFVLSALAGGGLHVWMAEGAALRGLAVGASGGIFGVIGALGVWAFTSKEPAARAMRGSVLFFLVIAAAMSLIPQMGIWGHAGGLVGGALTFVLLGPRGIERRPASRGLVVLGVLLLLGVLGAGVAQATRPARARPEALRPLFEELARMEGLARRLYEAPQRATPEKRAELGRLLDHLLVWPSPEDPESRSALHAYLDAWRPVADGNVPDPFSFDQRLEAARTLWRDHEKRLRAASGLTRTFR